MVKFSSFKLSR